VYSLFKKISISSKRVTCTESNECGMYFKCVHGDEILRCALIEFHIVSPFDIVFGKRNIDINPANII